MPKYVRPSCLDGERIDALKASLPPTIRAGAYPRLTIYHPSLHAIGDGAFWVPPHQPGM